MGTIRQIQGLMLATMAVVGPKPALADSQPCLAAKASIEFVAAHYVHQGRQAVIEPGAPYNNAKTILKLGDPVADLVSISRQFESRQRQSNSKNVPVGAPPSAETIRAFVRADDTDPATTCPGFKAAARQTGIRYVAGREAKRLSKPARDGLFPVDWIALATPVLNRAENEGLAFLSLASGRLAGTTLILFLRKGSDGHWTVVQPLTIAVS
jgi:hypothetical protein